jgi:hypothetical protein
MIFFRISRSSFSECNLDTREETDVMGSLRLWKGTNVTVGIVVDYELEESGLDSWKGKEFVCLPEGPYRLCGPPSLLFGSYWGSSLGGSGRDLRISGDILQNLTPLCVFRERTGTNLLFLHCTFLPGFKILTHSIYKLHGLSPRANYTDRAAAAGRRS